MEGVLEVLCKCRSNSIIKGVLVKFGMCLGSTGCVKGVSVECIVHVLLVCVLGMLKE